MPLNKNPRTQFLISFTNIYFSVLACIYLCLAIYGYLTREIYTGTPIAIIGLFTLGAVASVILSKTKHNLLAFLYIPITTISLSFYAGISWGFDMPSVLLTNIIMLIFVSLVSDTRHTYIFLVLILGFMLIGGYVREYLNIHNTWKQTPFRIDDMIEYTTLFIYAGTLIIFSNREQQKLLSRSIRSEHALKLERDNLSNTVEIRTREIKQMQMEHISNMYRFVEFGKISAGLFHDLMSPLQSLKLKLEQVPGIDTVKQSYNRLEQLMLGARQQIRLTDTKETFSIVEDIRTICDMIRYITVKHCISIHIHVPTPDTIHANRTVLNHILHNLITNACEAVYETNIKNIDITVNIKNVNSFSVEVRDSGVGIKPEDMEKIFDPFYSTKNIASSNCGIGLSSAKFCTEKYLLGTLTCNSVPNNGTCMTITV